jgi:anti-anti-sigma factor
MEIEKIEDNEKGIVVLKMTGKLDVFSFGDLKAYFDDLYAQIPTVKVVCDISGVSYIASSGWSVLLSRRKIARREGGNLCLLGLEGDIRRVYDSMKIGKLLPCVQDMDQAIAVLSEDGQ